MLKEELIKFIEENIAAGTEVKLSQIGCGCCGSDEVEDDAKITSFDGYVVLEGRWQE